MRQIIGTHTCLYLNSGSLLCIDAFDTEQGLILRKCAKDFYFPVKRVAKKANVDKGIHYGRR